MKIKLNLVLNTTQFSFQNSELGNMLVIKREIST